MAYRPTIGLEIHAELKTRTKMFCESANNPDEKQPNANVCPVCTAHPGTLPVINKEAVRHVLRLGTAVGGTIADYTEFDRKSYFYPDIPKGYQISQYEHPLVSGGELAGVALTRVHLEEDTARSSHADGVSLVDFNRAGVPLMELVTEPVIHDAPTAGKFARELQLLLRTLGAGEANLEKGEMRVEANISVSEDNTLGTKVEVKNLNSFRAVERAIEYEITRQSELLGKGGTVVQETRGWDEDRGLTFSQRLKEGAADYRYFPEPDLPKMVLSELPEFAPDALRATLPELSWETRARYASLGLTEAETELLLAEPALRTLFEGVAGEAKDDTKRIRLAANYVVSDLMAHVRDADTAGSLEQVSIGAFAALMRMTAEGKLSSRGTKDVLTVMYREGGEPEAIAAREGLLQVSDEGALRTAVQGVIEANPAATAEYRAGKEAPLQYLIGQSMKATKGAGNPGVIRTLLIEELGK